MTVAVFILGLALGLLYRDVSIAIRKRHEKKLLDYTLYCDKGLPAAFLKMYPARHCLPGCPHPRWSGIDNAQNSHTDNTQAD